MRYLFWSLYSTAPAGDSLLPSVGARARREGAGEFEQLITRREKRLQQSMERSLLACGAATQVESGAGFRYGQSCQCLVLFTSSKHFPNEQRKTLFIGESPTEATRRARHEYEWKISFPLSEMRAVFLSAGLESASFCARVIKCLCVELHNPKRSSYIKLWCNKL